LNAPEGRKLRLVSNKLKRLLTFMDANFEVLLILVGAASAFGLVVAVCLSERVRAHGLIGALRRAFSDDVGRSPYSR
jgi:hypothetical protein